MTTDKNKRVRVGPGIYRRGRHYEVRVVGRDAAGNRRFQWSTIGTSLREARAALVQLKASAARQPLPPAKVSRALTVRSFLEDHYLPYLDNERVAKRGDLHKNTAVIYRRYATSKVIPVLGSLRVAEVNPGHIESLLNDLRVGGRHPRAGLGRRCERPGWVYEFVAARRVDGWTFSETLSCWTRSTRPTVRA
jgi:hypothetical protein